MTATVGVACSASTTPTPQTTSEEYVRIFNEVSIRLLNDTRLMGQIAGFMVGDVPARAEFKDSAGLILNDLNTQLGRMEALEPVPPGFEEAQESLKVAIGKYIEAARLFLPKEGDEVSMPFDFTAFNELMQTGGKSYHDAGRLTGEAQ